jgi:hypothetical protein
VSDRVRNNFAKRVDGKLIAAGIGGHPDLNCEKVLDVEVTLARKILLGYVTSVRS